MILTIPWNIYLKSVTYGDKTKHDFDNKTRTQGYEYIKEQGKEHLNNSSFNMLIFFVQLAQQQEIPKH
jgi:hypothetical protein